MADVVIIIGARRGQEVVSVSSLRQMCGRAGRKHGGESCEAYILLESEDAGDIEKGINGGDNYNIVSSMTSCDDLIFHLTAEICSGLVSNEEDAKQWYSRSLGAIQGMHPDFNKTFKKLEEMGAIEYTPLGYIPTDIARISSEFYFHPANVRAWRDNFNEVFEMGLSDNDVALAWALGSIPIGDSPGDFGQHRFVMSLYKEALPEELTALPGTIARGTLWWNALGGPSVGRMRNSMLELRKDFGRIVRVLMSLDKSEDWGMDGFFISLSERIKKGVPEHLEELCSVGISKSLADFLYNVGVNNVSEIKDCLDSLDGEIDEKTMAFLRGIGNGVR